VQAINLKPGNLRVFLLFNLFNLIVNNGWFVQRDPDACGEVVQGRGDGGPHQRQHPAPGGHSDPPHRGRSGGEGRGNIQVRDEGLICMKGREGRGNVQVRDEGVIYRTRGGREEGGNI
jgi:hypothetical protein